MNTIILIVNENTSWSPQYWIEKKGGGINIFHQLVLNKNDGWISIVKDQTILNDYDKKEISEIINTIQKPVFHVIEWKGDHILEEFLNEIPFDIEALIDNDHGLISKACDLSGKPVSSWITKNSNI